MKKISVLSKLKNGKTARSKLSAIYILIAVVAVIECLILISFTTFSWIETASSLVIETGKKNYDATYSTRIPIANALNYKFIVNTATPNDSDISDLNGYFSYAGQSSTQNLYRYARASSANGKDFFFVNSGRNASNSTITGSTSYRAGDYADINSNYTYFDFTVANTGGAKNNKLKFYFKTADVFTVTNGDGSSLTQTQLNYIRDAMRISFQTGTGTPKIYSRASANYSAVSATDGGTTSITTTAIQANENQKLFTIGKNTTQNISVRIWLEEKATGISGLTGAQLAGANVNVNLQLTYAQNDYDYLYFDDYTFSSGLNNKENIGGHLTEDYAESNEKRMYFAYSTNGSTYTYYPMTVDDSGSNTDAKCWITCDSSGTPAASVPDITGSTYITNLTTSGNAALNYSYFAYGACNTSAVNTTTAPSASPLYKWYLYGANASSETELRFTGYSVTNTAAGAANAYGAGGWTYNTPLSMVYFRDLATCNLLSADYAYNAGDNFKYITAAVNAASDTGTGNRSNVMYVNYDNTLFSTSGHAAADQAPYTATMYFDKGLDGGSGLFKSWVPTAWFTNGTNDNERLTFRYGPRGYLNLYCAITWTAGAPTKPNNANDYIYTGLGYSSYRQLAYFNYNSQATARVATGTGCWNAIESEPVYFSTELVDNWAAKEFRYQIGVNIAGGGLQYYNLIPDDSNMRFYAYIPMPGTNATPTSDYANGAIRFRSYASTSGTANGSWYGRVRNGSRTYYPVVANTTTASSAAPKGYWNLAVIVDGTYEHFFWDTRVASDPDDDGVLGTFSYNTSGHVGSPTYTDITPYMIDQYRWYVPFDITTIGAMPESVYFKWEPYEGTVFKYTHYRSDGIYCVITEASDSTPANAFS